MKCEICEKELSPIGMGSHLSRKHNLTNQEYYDKYIKKENEGICEVCGKPTKFDTLLTGYRPYCSTKCVNLDPKIRQKIEQTSIEKYGVKCNLNLEKTKKKANKNSQTKKAKEKRANTNLEKYGAENVFASEYGKQKIKETNLEKYGVEYSFQAEKVKEKIKQTNLERYGTEYATQSENIKEKRKSTFKKKYNSTCPFNSNEIQQQIKQTNLEKYGTKNIFASEYGKQKIKETNIEKYGVEYPNQNNQIKQKTQQNKEKYIKNYEKQNNCTSVPKLAELYGKGWLQSNLKNEIVFKHKEITYVKNTNIPKIIKYIENSGSHLEKDFYDFIKSIYKSTILRRHRKSIYPLELDIYLPDIKLAIEINGIYYHSIENNVTKDYHLQKSLLCKEKGIRLIHIYEFEDLEKQKQLLKDLIIDNIDNFNYKDFNKNNLIKKIPKPKIIYKDKRYTIYGAGKLY